MAPADCVQKSALIFQLRFLLFMRESERRAGRAAAAEKEQTAVFILDPEPHTHTHTL